MIDHYPDPESDAAARAAQIAAVTIALGEAIARVRQERTARQAADDRHAATAARADRIASHAAARVAWAPALNERWLQRADVPVVLDAWAPAVGWAHTDHAARKAAALIEQRLAAAFPIAMQRYAQARAEGNDPATAMGEAAPFFAEAAPTPVVSSPPIKQLTATPVRTTTRQPARRR